MTMKRDTDNAPSMASISSEGSIEGLIVEQEEIAALTHNVRHFKESLGKLRRSFNADRPQSLHVATHERLGEVLRILRSVLEKYPALKSSEMLTTAGTLIHNVKCYNYDEDQGEPKEFFDAIDQLALAFSSRVSELLMGDLDTNVSLSSSVSSKTKSCEHLANAAEENAEKKADLLSPQEIDTLLLSVEQGVDFALHRAKVWAKFAKDVMIYVEQRTRLDLEYAKNLSRIAHSASSAINQETSLAFQAIYCTGIENEVERANSMQATCTCILGEKFMEPISLRRGIHECTRKRIKERWHRELTYMHDVISRLRKARHDYQHAFHLATLDQSQHEKEALNKLGKTKFHLSQHFELSKGNTPILAEKIKPGIGGVPLAGNTSNVAPSLYGRGEVPEQPAWLAYDRQVLRFDAFFQETVDGRVGCPSRIRAVNIFFYLEDGTVLVYEPRTIDAANQGTLISRQRIPYPAPRDGQFYGVLDFNIGLEVNLYSRVFKITSCDKFTLNFLNRCGIAVPDPINMPVDPYAEQRHKAQSHCYAKKPNTNERGMEKFLRLDRQVLNFGAVWDDRANESGYLHKLSLRYYLSDDTMEIIEVNAKNSGIENGSVFLHRGKVPKVFRDLPGPGADKPVVLNLLTTGFLQGRFLVDPLSVCQGDLNSYCETDFAIGGSVDIYGRKIILTDCDKFTQDFYRIKYGQDNFEPFILESEIPPPPPPPKAIPAWNGYGTYEDSLGNCFSLEPSVPKVDFYKFMENDRVGLDSHILRFRAELVSDPIGKNMHDYAISYYLNSDAIGVFQRVARNSGLIQGKFITAEKQLKPHQNLYVSTPPDFYTIEDMYVGNILEITSFKFLLVDADEYALTYMENNSSQFPKSDIKLILIKIREALAPFYKDFVAEHWLVPQPMKYCDLRHSLRKLLGDKIVEQEILTVGRYYNAFGDKVKHTKEQLREISHDFLKRVLFDDFEKLEIMFRRMDRCRSGYLSRDKIFPVLRGIRLPLDKELLETVLDSIAKNADGELSYCDVLKFLDYKKCPAVPIPIRYFKSEFGEFSPLSHDFPCRVNANCLMKDLALEEMVKTQSG